MKRSKKRVLVVGGLALLGAMVLGGCETTVAKYAYELDIPEGTDVLALDIENFRGSIEVRSGRGEPGRALVLGKVVTSGDVDDGERAVVERGVGVEAAVDSEGGRGVLRVRTTGAPERHEDEVRLYVEVPRCDGLRIVNRGGDVEVVGTGGTTHIENRGGAIELRTAQEMNEDVRLLVVDGNIYYQVPPGSTGAFDLETLSGEVAMRDFTGMSDGTHSSRTTLTTSLGDAGNTVLARTNRGNIRVWVMEDPEGLTRMYKDSVPDYRDYIFLGGSRRFTRNLPDEEVSSTPRGSRSNPGG